MNGSTNKQFWKLKTKANELELMPLVGDSKEKPLRRICRIISRQREAAGTEGQNQQTEESGETSRQRSIKDDCSHLREAPSSDNVKDGKLEESLPRFGPLYSVDQPSVDATKKKAWEHVLKKSSQEQEVTMEIYLTAIRKVEQEAKAMYYYDKKGSSTIEMGSNFRWMMIKDGCFFLQLALLILGCSEQLDYPPNDPIFGRKKKEEDIKKWMEAMFYVGNQIPLLILRELMNQEFFKNVVTKRKWDCTPSGLCENFLYEVLVLPALRKDPVRPSGRGNNDLASQQSSDLLHAIQNLVVGPAPLDHLCEADGQIDLEANEDEIADYDSIFPVAAVDDEQGTSPIDIGDRMRNFLNAIGFRYAVDNRKRIFPCATELKRAGIHIRKMKSGRVRNIYFKSWYLRAYLYIPAFPVDENTELVFRNLKTYENLQQQFGRNRREISSYLRFMSDIVQTTRDATLLQKNGIIEGNNSDDDVEKLPRILSRLSSEEDKRLTQELRMVRRQISDYSSPMIHYKGVLNVVVFLTLIQTFFALLAYFRPPKP